MSARDLFINWSSLKTKNTYTNNYLHSSECDFQFFFSFICSLILRGDWRLALFLVHFFYYFFTDVIFGIQCVLFFSYFSLSDSKEIKTMDQFKCVWNKKIIIRSTEMKTAGFSGCHRMPSSSLVLLVLFLLLLLFRHLLFIHTLEYVCSCVPVSIVVLNAKLWGGFFSVFESTSTRNMRCRYEDR